MTDFPMVVTALGLLLGSIEPAPQHPTEPAAVVPRVPVLMYHVIADPPPGASWPQLYVSPLTWNTHLQRWLLIGADQVDVRTDPGTTKWGVYFSVSKDLVTWETQRLVFARNMAFVHNCGDPDPIMYPTLIDHASPSRSFETTGSRAYLYYTVMHYDGCRQTLDRDLVRVPVTISK